MTLAEYRQDRTLWLLLLTVLRDKQEKSDTDGETRRSLQMDMATLRRAFGRGLPVIYR